LPPVCITAYIFVGSNAENSFKRGMITAYA
jgi:hypothetical protein